MRGSASTAIVQGLEMDFLLKEAERLCKKQRTLREAQLGKVDELQRRVDEARTELEGIGASLCCHPQLRPLAPVLFYSLFYSSLL